MLKVAELLIPFAYNLNQMLKKFKIFTLELKGICGFGRYSNNYIYSGVNNKYLILSISISFFMMNKTSSLLYTFSTPISN